MPKLGGVFDKFQGLGAIPIADLTRWLNFRTAPDYLENYLSNRLIYPQTVSMSPQELQIDLAILRECLKRDEKTLYDKVKSSIVLTPEFLVHFPPKELALALADALSLGEKTFILMKSPAGVIPLGTIINWRSSGEKKYDLLLQTGDNKTPPKRLLITRGNFTVIPCQVKGPILRINSDKLMEVAGGEMGVVVDTREAENR